MLHQIQTMNNDAFVCSFKGPLNGLPFQRAFSQTTLTCALGPPPTEHARLLADYNAALATLKSLLPKQTDTRSGHVYQNVASQHLRLRHAVFAVSAFRGILLFLHELTHRLSFSPDQIPRKRQWNLRTMVCTFPALWPWRCLTSLLSSRLTPPIYDRGLAHAIPGSRGGAVPNCHHPRRTPAACIRPSR